MTIAQVHANWQEDAKRCASMPAPADNDPDPGVRCVAASGPGNHEFYLPGERATNKDGNKWVCGPDGQWFREYSSSIRSPITRVPANLIRIKAVASRAD